ncbi:MAG: hypothetical protein IT223_10245, partial [Crocinitomicaceae bacterium]|nr:hypothetical protein [Crocinitomicaceae bacterium]
IDIKDDTRLFRTSLIMALGIEYNLSGSTSLVAGVTFNNGFSNFMNGSGASSNEKGNIIDVKGTEVNTKGTMPASYKLKAMNNYLALTVGVLF